LNPSENKLFVFENLAKGFVIFHMEGKAFIASLNPNVDKLIKANGLGTPCHRLDQTAYEKFLTELEQVDNIFSRHIVKGEPEPFQICEHSDSKGLSRLIARNGEGAVVVRPASHRDNKGLVTVNRNPEGGLVIGCDQSLGTRVLRSIERDNHPGIPGVAARTVSPTKVLEKLVRTIELPIVERAIPSQFMRVSLKYTCPQISPYPTRTGETSATEPNGNRIAIENAIAGLLNRWEQNQEVHDAVRKLHTAADKFAAVLAQKGGLQSFSVTIALVPTDEGGVDFYFEDVDR
jgi:hypothetical protein